MTSPFGCNRIKYRVHDNLIFNQMMTSGNCAKA